MRTISYEMFLDLITALDEHTECKYTRKDLSRIVFRHYIKEGPFLAYNSWGTKAYYSLEIQERDFVRFMDLIKNQKSYAKVNSKSKATRSILVCSEC